MAWTWSSGYARPARISASDSRPRHAAQVFIGGAVEGQAFFVGQALPGAIVELGGVGEDAVEVKDESRAPGS
jgi:hypothetical protein